MKYLLLVLALFTFSAQAEKVYTADYMGLCQSIAETARMTMKTRQMGASLSRMLEIEGDELSRSITIEAYRVPMYRTEANKKYEETKYADRWMLECLDSYK